MKNCLSDIINTYLSSQIRQELSNSGSELSEAAKDSLKEVILILPPNILLNELQQELPAIQIEADRVLQKAINKQPLTTYDSCLLSLNITDVSVTLDAFYSICQANSDTEYRRYYTVIIRYTHQLKNFLLDSHYTVGHLPRELLVFICIKLQTYKHSVNKSFDFFVPLFRFIGTISLCYVELFFSKLLTHEYSINVYSSNTALFGDGFDIFTDHLINSDLITLILTSNDLTSAESNLSILVSVIIPDMLHSSFATMIIIGYAIISMCSGFKDLNLFQMYVSNFFTLCFKLLVASYANCQSLSEQIVKLVITKGVKLVLSVLEFYKIDSLCLSVQSDQLIMTTSEAFKHYILDDFIRGEFNKVFNKFLHDKDNDMNEIDMYDLKVIELLKPVITEEEQTCVSTVRDLLEQMNVIRKNDVGDGLLLLIYRLAVYSGETDPLTSAFNNFNDYTKWLPEEFAVLARFQPQVDCDTMLEAMKEVYMINFLKMNKVRQTYLQATRKNIDVTEESKAQIRSYLANEFQQSDDSN